jgi:hypothetical protein
MMSLFQQFPIVILVLPNTPIIATTYLNFDKRFIKNRTKINFIHTNLTIDHSQCYIICYNIILYRFFFFFLFSRFIFYYRLFCSISSHLYYSQQHALLHFIYGFYFISIINCNSIFPIIYIHPSLPLTLLNK